MSDNDPVESARVEYDRLAGEHEVQEATLRRLGRSDVPLDDRSHIANADAATQAQWWDAYRGLTKIDSKRSKALQRYLLLLRDHGS